MRDYSSRVLLQGIRRRASLPDSQNLFSDQDLLGFLNGELDSLLVPLIVSHRSEYFTRSIDIPLVAGRAAYPLPDSSIVMGLRSVCIVDADGQIYPIEQGSIERSSGNQPHAFESYYIMNNDLIFDPIPREARTIRLFYYKSPKEVIDVNETGKITAIDENTNTVTLDNLPSAWIAGDLIDVCSSKPGFDCKAESLEIISTSSPSLVLSSVQNLVVGDYVSESGTSPVPQVPAESHKILEQAVAVKCLESMGENTDRAERKLQEMLAGFSRMITPRSKGSSQAITSNGRGILNLGRLRGPRRFR